MIRIDAIVAVADSAELLDATADSPRAACFPVIAEVVAGQTAHDLRFGEVICRGELADAALAVARRGERIAVRGELIVRPVLATEVLSDDCVLLTIEADHLDLAPSSP